VRRTIFVDTSWLVALIDQRDQHQEAALRLAATLAGEDALLLSTDAVILELCNYFARSPLRSEAITWVEEVRGAPGWEIVPIERTLLRRAERLYHRHHDKNWSLTDCLSMELMRGRKMTEAATTDAGFRQAGFRTLL
jgi:predicted nucleic acid-binding protein